MGILSDLLGFARGAVEPAAAARVGYLQGQDQEADKKRAQAIQQTELDRQARLDEQTRQRQSTLDQLKAAVDQSTITRNNASAQRATTAPRSSYMIVKANDGTQYLQNKNNATDRQKITGDSGEPIIGATAAPKTKDTENGTFQYDPVTDSWFDTGMKPPPRAARGGSAGGGSGSSSKDRLDAKTALDEAAKSIPRPSKVDAMIPNPALRTAPPGTDIKKLAPTVPNPDRAKVTADSVAYEQSTMAPLRQHLMDVTVGDKVKIGSARTPTTDAPSAPSTPSVRLDAGHNAAMEAELQQATDQYKQVLDSAAPAELKERARKAYEARQQFIAKKYGATQQP